MKMVKDNKSKKDFQEVSLYRPVVLKYKCRGAIHFQQPRVQNEQPVDTSDLAATAPTCHGIETELERMYEFQPMTASESVLNFAQYTSTTVAGSTEAWQARRNRMEMGFGGKMEREISNEKPKEEDLIKKFPIVIDHRAIDYEAVEEDDLDNSSSSDRPGTLDRLREASRQNIDYWSDRPSNKKVESTFWTTTAFYGMTDITILVLFPYLNPYAKKKKDITDKMKKETVSSNAPVTDDASEKGVTSAILAALAPELKLGLVVRKAGDRKNPGTVDELNTARIGPIEISVGSRYDEDELDEDLDEQRGDLPKKKILKKTDDIINKDITWEEASSSMKDAIQKTASRMVTNFNLIRSELSDDFVSRTIVSGERVLDHCGKTIQRMKKLASDLYDHWRG